MNVDRDCRQFLNEMVRTSCCQLSWTEVIAERGIMIPLHEVIGTSTEFHCCCWRSGAPALFIGLDGIMGCVQTFVGAVVEFSVRPSELARECRQRCLELFCRPSFVERQDIHATEFELGTAIPEVVPRSWSCL